MTLRDEASKVIGGDTTARTPSASSVLPRYLFDSIREIGFDLALTRMRLTRGLPFRNQGVLPQAVGASSTATTELLCGSASSLPDGLRSGGGCGGRGGDCLHESSGPPVTGPDGARTHPRGLRCARSDPRAGADPIGPFAAERAWWAPHLPGGSLLRRDAWPVDGRRPPDGERELPFRGDTVGCAPGPVPRSISVAVGRCGVPRSSPEHRLPPQPGRGAAVSGTVPERFRHVPSVAVGTSRRASEREVPTVIGPAPEAAHDRRATRRDRGPTRGSSAHGAVFSFVPGRGPRRLDGERRTNERIGRTNPRPAARPGKGGRSVRRTPKCEQGQPQPRR